MKITKFLLNSLISALVTYDRVLKATEIPVKYFDNMLVEYGKTGQKNPSEHFDGVTAFIEDFRKEGWCKREFRSIFGTLFHLNREINAYADYWF